MSEPQKCHKCNWFIKKIDILNVETRKYLDQLQKHINSKNDNTNNNNNKAPNTNNSNNNNNNNNKITENKSIENIKENPTDLNKNGIIFFFFISIF